MICPADHDADADAATSHGVTALMLVARGGHADCVKLLLPGPPAHWYIIIATLRTWNLISQNSRMISPADHGADANAAATDGRTAVTAAIIGGHPGCIRLLLPGCVRLLLMQRHSRQRAGRRSTPPTSTDEQL